MDKKEHNIYPQGHFPVHIIVEGKNTMADALCLLEQFIEQSREKHPSAVVKQPTGNSTHAEAFITVPFPDRENIRIEFNIFASDMEDEHGTGLYFYMESAF